MSHIATWLHCEPLFRFPFLGYFLKDVKKNHQGLGPGFLFKFKPFKHPNLYPMKHFLLSLVLTRLLLFVPLWGQNAYFLSEPTLSPDGTSIVFVYENDLWQVSAQGGTAMRLTALQGKVSNPRISPDGQWIAFSSTRDRNANVYLMPAQGGEIRQLTFHQSNDWVDSWSWDSQNIYFSSNRENASSVYQVSIHGGTPKRLFGHYFNMEHHLVVHPLTGEYIFTESGESLSFPQRKRYKGENRPDLLSFNPQSQVFRKLTDYEGKDLWPSVDRQGNLYFASDEYNDEYNLYTFRNGEKTPLTRFATSIKRPQVSADGRLVVFEKDYQIFIYDVSLGQSKAVNIALFQLPAQSPLQGFETKGQITWFDVSPDQKKIAFVSRGELFVSDMEGRFVRQLPIVAGERVLEVQWLHDNKTLVYIRTHKGWANVFVADAEGKTPERQLENVAQTSRQLTLNAQRDQAVYLSGRNEVRWVDLKKFTTKVLVKDELWGFQNSSPGFSPDGQYVAFTAYRNFEQDILIHHIASSRTYNLTNSGVTQRQPWWSPDGKYIYFVSDRISPNYPRSNTQTRIYRLPLSRFAEPNRHDHFEKLFGKDEKNEKSDQATPAIVLDLERLEERWEEISIRGGVQSAPQVFNHKDAQLLFFVSNHERGEMALWKMELKPFHERKAERIQGPNPGGSPQIVKAKDDYYVLAGGNIHKINVGGSKLEPIDINHRFSRRLSDEFSQVFYETWATLEENFYDDELHGVDWKAMLQRYEAYLPHLRSRDNLRVLLNDMLGELNASHMGFTSTGKEEEPFFVHETAETGIIFSATNPFAVERIIRKSHLDLTQIPVLPGDILLAVNGQRIDTSLCRDRYFYLTSRPAELVLTFGRQGREFTVVTKPHTPAQISDLLYDEWIAQNRAYVNNQSDNRIAYTHMKNMSQQALEQFLIDMTTFAQDKDALILDLRFNRGGNVHNDVLQFLAQRPYLSWKYRGGKLAPQPNFAPSAKPIVLLINERSLSDAEMTAEGFRRLGLGKIIGIETYRWIIFTSGKSFVDGSFCRLPSWGCYSLDGDNLELTGVAPDIVVDEHFLHRLNHQNPQLDKAIEEILKQL